MRGNDTNRRVTARIVDALISIMQAQRHDLTGLTPLQHSLPSDRKRVHRKVGKLYSAFTNWWQTRTVYIDG